MLINALCCAIIVNVVRKCFSVCMCMLDTCMRRVSISATAPSGPSLLLIGVQLLHHFSFIMFDGWPFIA